MTVNGVQLLKTIFKKDLVIYLMKIIRVPDLHKVCLCASMVPGAPYFRLLFRGIQKGWRTNNSLNLPMMLSDCSSLFSLWFCLHMMRWSIGVSLCSCLIYIQWRYRLLSACSPFFRILEASWFRRQEAVWQGVFAGFPIHASMYSETRGPASHQWCGSWQGKLSTQWKPCLLVRTGF